MSCPCLCLCRVICLCAQFEAVLQHGLRKSRGLALTAAALKQVAGFSSKTEAGTMVNWMFVSLYGETRSVSRRSKVEKDLKLGSNLYFGKERLRKGITLPQAALARCFGSHGGLKDVDVSWGSCKLQENHVHTQTTWLWDQMVRLQIQFKVAHAGRSLPVSAVLEWLWLCFTLWWAAHLLRLYSLLKNIWDVLNFTVITRTRHLFKNSSRDPTELVASGTSRK